MKPVCPVLKGHCAFQDKGYLYWSLSLQTALRKEKKKKNPLVFITHLNIFQTDKKKNQTLAYHFLDKCCSQEAILKNSSHRDSWGRVSPLQVRHHSPGVGLLFGWFSAHGPPLCSPWNLQSGMNYRRGWGGSLDCNLCIFLKVKGWIHMRSKQYVLHGLPWDYSCFYVSI